MDAIYEIFDTISELLRSEGLQEWGVWSYPLLTALVIVEGRIVTLLAAVAASVGYMRLPLVMVCAIVGGVVADSLWYLLGYKNAKGSLLRYGRWLGLRRHHLEQLQAEMQVRGPRLLFVAKSLSVLVIPALVAAGMARVPGGCGRDALRPSSSCGWRPSQSPACAAADRLWCDRSCMPVRAAEMQSCANLVSPISVHLSVNQRCRR